MHPHPVDALIDLAEATLVTFLGAEWVTNQVRGAGESNFFRIMETRESDAFRHHHRYISLAENLFNLQDRAGFAGRIDLLKQNDVEAAVAELEVGKFLACCGIPFCFRETVGVLGEDYDIEIAHTDLGGIPVEGKCKVEGTAYSMSTIRNSLVQARRQLPPDRPGVVFLKLLEEWFLTDATVEALERALGTFLRNTRRVGGVVLLWERWHFAESGGRVSTRFDFRLSPNAPASFSMLDELFTTDPRAAAWLDYSSLVGL